MSRPEGMSRDVWERIGRLRADVRDRVLERSCLIFLGGGAASWAEADERALAEGAGQPTQKELTR